MKTQVLQFSVVLLLLIGLLSCGKDFLEVKRKKSERTPVSLEDYEALANSLNTLSTSSSHELGMIGGDEYYVTDGRLTTLTNPYQRNGYVWAQEVYEGADVNDWNRAYTRILYSNVILSGIDKVKNINDQGKADQIKARALFSRASSYYQLTQLFVPPINSENKDLKYGLPLRTLPDVEIGLKRSSIAEVYNLILTDLNAAKELFDDATPKNKMAGSKAATYALLAKTYLQLGDYEKAFLHADLCLASNSRLIDFNAIDRTLRYPFANDYGGSNVEVIHYSSTSIPVILGNRFNIDRWLYNSYESDDLRLQAYFYKESDNRVTFKGTYTGDYSNFTGITTSEMILVRAETNARLNNLKEALIDLNYLLKNRTSKSSFIPLMLDNRKELIAEILLERRKELLMRGVRWEDLRRLNRDPEYAVLFTREIDGKKYELQPNDKRYTWPLPDAEVELLKLTQNER